MHNLRKGIIDQKHEHNSGDLLCETSIEDRLNVSIGNFNSHAESNFDYNRI